jgi:hypothetical protein
MKSLNDTSPEVKKYWMDHIWIPWNTFNKLPVLNNKAYKDFLNSFETEPLEPLGYYENGNVVIDNISKFPGIVNPKNDLFVADIATKMIGWNGSQRHDVFYLLKDFYAIPLITVYFSDPNISIITDPKQRLYQAQKVGAANFNELRSRMGSINNYYVPIADPDKYQATNPGEPIIINLPVQNTSSTNTTSNINTANQTLTPPVSNSTDILSTMDNTTKIILGLGVLLIIGYFALD